MLGWSVAGRQAQRMEKGGKVKSKGREACFLVWGFGFSRWLMGFFVAMAKACLQSLPVGGRHQDSKAGTRAPRWLLGVPQPIPWRDSSPGPSPPLPNSYAKAKAPCIWCFKPKVTRLGWLWSTNRKRLGIVTTEFNPEKPTSSTWTGKKNWQAPVAFLSLTGSWVSLAPEP